MIAVWKRTIIGMLTAGLLMMLVPQTEATQTTPNILIFLVDDMGLMDTSLPFMVDGKGKPKKYPLNELYRTPGMERLAENGLRFSRFYANSVCSPSRVSLITGQSSARHHTTQWINPDRRNTGPAEWNWKGLTKESITLPRLLASKGYHTIHCGKSHLGPFGEEGAEPRNVGYDVNIAGSAIGRPASYYGEKGYGKGSKREVQGLDAYHGSKTFLTEALTLEVNKAIDVSVSKNKDKPFFCHMSHYAVHSPFNSDPRFAANYTNSAVKGSAQAFATLIEGMDKSLGDMLDHLEKIGEAEETLVIFLGDNGSDAPLGAVAGIASSAPLRGKKGTYWEGGMRAPLIVSWAKVNPESSMQKAYPIKKGIVTDRLANIYDIMPTVLQATRVSAPTGHTMDGYDLSAQLAGRKDKHPQTFLMHFPHGHRSSYFTVYIEGDSKLIYHHRDKSVELYDLKADPAEATNLVQKEPAEAKRMEAAMNKALKDADAQFVKDPKSVTKKKKA